MPEPIGGPSVEPVSPEVLGTSPEPMGASPEPSGASPEPMGASTIGEARLVAISTACHNDTAQHSAQPSMLIDPSAEPLQQANETVCRGQAKARQRK